MKKSEIRAPRKRKRKATIKKPTPKKKKSSLSSALSKTKTVQPPHIVVKAYAGTGKTFSQIVGVARAFLPPERWPEVIEGMGFDPIPSDEQAAIWRSFASSESPTSITYCAFNKSIVNEFSETWGWLQEILSEEGINLRFATVNSLGYAVCRENYNRMKVTNYRSENILADLLGVDKWDLKKYHASLAKAVCSIVEKCKLTLLGWTEETRFHPENITDEEFDKLCSHFDIELNGNRQRVYELVPKVLDRSRYVDGEIDFNDQNWLPIVNALTIPKQDILLVDEAQDLPRCKQEFVRQMARRLVLVGDTHQAIYGFAGADTDAIPRMQKLLENSEQGCEVFKLTETRRCGKAIVKEAQKYVPDFKAHESNCEGLVKRRPLRGIPGKLPCDSYGRDVQDGDMVLCRVNAPLVSQALRFIKDGRKAIVRGRDFGGQLINFIKKLEATSIGHLLEKASKWLYAEEAKEHNKANPSESRIQNLQDRYDVICTFAADCKTVAEMLDKINLVFAGKACPTCGKHYNEETATCPAKDCKTLKSPEGWPIGPKLVTPEGIMFSSIHRAKGLEADRVFLIKNKDCQIPHPMAKTPHAKEQELHLLYIAITRSKSEFVYVS